MSRVEPSPEQLRAAFGVVRLPNWPTDFDEAMRDGVRQRLVRAAAVRIVLGQRVLPAEPPVHTRPTVVRPEPPPPRHTRAVMPPTTSTLFDRKRLAAGERADD